MQQKTMRFTPVRQTLAQAGYSYVKTLGHGKHVLQDNETGIQEIWVANKNHASYGLLWRNTDLEFVATYNTKEA